MMGDYITYRSGYHYQIVKDYEVQTEIFPAFPINTPFLALSPDGILTIRAGYAWDGPSGPTIDTVNFMRGSLIHDALYQLMRERMLDAGTHRETADRILQRICQEDGMSTVRAWWVYHAVRLGGGPSADPAHDKLILYAPRKE